MRQVVKIKFTTHLTTALVALLIIAPVLLNLIFITKFGVNCVYIDQWEMVPLFDKFYSGSLSFADLIELHSEHRIFVPRLVMLALGSITHYNNIEEMYLSWFLLCIICFIFFKLYIRTFGFSKISMARFIPVVWLIFSLRQYENLLRGDTSSMFLEILFFLLAVYLLTQSKRLDWRFALAVLCGVACTLSLAGGLLVWPVGLIQLLFSGRDKAKKHWGLDISRVVSWTIIGIAVYVLYFVDYVQPPVTAPLLYYNQQPVISFMFGLVALGSPLSLDMLTATSVGALLLLLYLLVAGVAVFKPAMLPVKFPYISLVLFSLVAVAGLLVTRSGGDWWMTSAYLSRYTTMTGLGIIGVYLLILSIDVKNTKLKFFLAVFLVSMITIGIGPTAVPVYWEIGEKMRSARHETAYYLTTCNLQNDETIIQYLYPFPDVARERMGILVKYKLNVFSDAILSEAGLERLDSAPSFKIDMLNDKFLGSAKPVVLEADKDETLKIVGWAVDRDAGQTAGGVLISIDESIDVPALYGLGRPDVAKYFKHDNYKYSGFEVMLPASVVGPGRHTIAIKVISADRTGYYLPVQILTLEIE